MKRFSKFLASAIAITLTLMAVPAYAVTVYEFYENGALVGQLEINDQGQECYSWGRTTPDYVVYIYPGVPC
jgi:hypothetical protein